MIKFDVLNRYTGSVQFTAEIDCDEGAYNSIKLGLSVIWAVNAKANLNRASLIGANLNRANLIGANLDGANLDGASLIGVNLNGVNLNGASLIGASLTGANGVNEWVKIIQIETYPISYTDTVMQIGCERHLISEWADFSDREIADMDGKAALKFWRKYKTWIFQTIKLCPANPTNAETPK